MPFQHSNMGSKFEFNNTYVQTNKNDSEVSIVKQNSYGQETFAKKKHRIKDMGDSIDIQISPYEQDQKPELEFQKLCDIQIS